VSEAGGEVFLEIAVRAEVEFLTVGRVVVRQDLDEAIRLEGRIACAIIVNIRIEKSGDLEMRALHLHQAIVGDRFRDAAGSENGVEFTVLAERHPIRGNSPSQHPQQAHA